MTTPTTTTLSELSADERAALRVLEGGASRYTIDSIERRSPREFDLGISGWFAQFSTPHKFSAWLPLAVIGEANWVELADHSDYPSMVWDGDWSGIRDSSEEAIWRMFEIVRGA